MQQRAEILKTLYRGADILIFDEPTAVLTPHEIQELIQIMKNLVNEGKSIILITHKLKEIMEVCDRVTIIRKGKGITTLDVAHTDQDELASLMVGREVSFKTDKQPAEPKQEVLSLSDVTVKDARGVEAVKQLSLSVRAGEIVGIAGVDGNGQSELIEAITGLRKTNAGTITLNGKQLQNMPPRKVTESGIGHIPQDRHKHGLVLDFPIGENIVLQSYYQKPYSSFGILNKHTIYDKARSLIEEYDVRTPDEYTPARALSGGISKRPLSAGKWTEIRIF